MRYGEDSDELEPEHEPEPRPAVFPTIVLPRRIASLGSATPVGAALLVMVSAFVTAISYRQPNPPSFSGAAGQALNAARPAFGFADRMSLFTSTGADIAVALLIAVGAVASVMFRDEGSAGRLLADLRRSALVVAAGLASAVVVANIIMAVVVLRGTNGIFIGSLSANKVSSVIGLLAPTLIASGVIVYSVSRVRSRPANDG